MAEQAIQEQKGPLIQDFSDYSDANSFRTSDEEFGGLLNRAAPAGTPFRKSLPWLIHVMIFSVYTVILFSRDWRPTKRFPTELQSVENFIHYEETVFKKSGFHPLSQRITKYEGRPTEEINANWDELWDVGMVTLTEEENERLPVQTAGFPPYHDNPAQFPVTIAMFHQLHCLDRLRYVAWTGNMNPANETAMVSQKHTDHCIDYLRQAIMCYGDTTPMPLKIVPDHYGLPFYDTDWEVHHTCRNFDSIYEWATIYNTTGLHI